MENLEYSRLKFSTRYTSDEAQAILVRFMERYVDKEKFKRSINEQIQELTKAVRQR